MNCIPMTKEHEYRKIAAEAVDLANRANSTADKGRRLAIAEAWLALAERVHEVSLRHPMREETPEHPLIERKFGRHDIAK